MMLKEKQTLKAAATTFSVCPKTARKWLARHRADGLADLPDRSPRPHHSPRCTAPLRGQRVGPPPPRGVRHERATPGELPPLHTKKPGRSERVGHRITADRRDHMQGAGWECVHVCIDDHSRVAYAEMLAKVCTAVTWTYLMGLKNYDGGVT